MSPLLATHIAAGGFALVAGALALVSRKGQCMHRLTGQVFVVAMLALGVTASILGPLKAVPDRGAFVVVGLVSYFVATAWWTMRNRSGRAGAFEITAAVVAFGCAALYGAFGLEGLASKAGGMERYKAVASLFNATFLLLGGIGDIVFLLRRRLTAPQRLVRHLWRMCFVLFLATGSFFLGQQDAMPLAVRGSPVLVALAFAPFALLVFWVFRVRFAHAYGAIAGSLPTGPAERAAPWRAPLARNAGTALRSGAGLNEGSGGDPAEPAHHRLPRPHRRSALMQRQA